MAFISTAALNARIDNLAEAESGLNEAWDAYDRGDAPDRGDIDYAFSHVETAALYLTQFLASALAAPAFVYA